MGQTAKRRTTITVDLGELKTPWQTYCAQQGVTPSHALRQVVRQALDQTPRPSAAPRLRVTRRRERATARIKLNVTTSELAALTRSNQQLLEVLRNHSLV